MGSMKVWDGTAWQTASIGPSLPPVTSVDGRTGAVSLGDLYASRSPFTQYVGARTVTTDVNAAIFVTFPTPFQSNDVAVNVMNATPGIPLMMSVQHTNVSATGFVIQAWRHDGVLMTNVAIAFMYSAVGMRP